MSRPPRIDSPAVINAWQKLLYNYEISGKRSHDARLVATMLTHELDFILTFDIEDFRSLGVAIVDPNDFGGLPSEI